MLIGELARRLGVSPRTLRHYEAVGLLRPARVDDRTGYRHFGADALVRGVRIAQLKAAGLTLAEIAAALDGSAEGAATLRRRRDALAREIEHRRRQATVLDGLLAGGIGLSTPTVVTVADVAVVSTLTSAPAGDLAPCIRRQVQRLRRRLGRSEGWTFAAQFPAEPAGLVDVEVAASGPTIHAPTATWPGGEVVRVEVVGPQSLLPLAHDAARAAALADGRALAGTVRETYVALAPLLRTTVDVPILPAVPAPTAATVTDPPSEY